VVLAAINWLILELGLLPLRIYYSLAPLWIACLLVLLSLINSFKYLYLFVLPFVLDQIWLSIWNYIFTSQGINPLAKSAQLFIDHFSSSTAQCRSYGLLDFSPRKSSILRASFATMLGNTVLVCSADCRWIEESPLVEVSFNFHGHAVELLWWTMHALILCSSHPTWVNSNFVLFLFSAWAGLQLCCQVIRFFFIARFTVL